MNENASVISGNVRWSLERPSERLDCAVIWIAESRSAGQVTWNTSGGSHSQYIVIFVGFEIEQQRVSSCQRVDVETNYEDAVTHTHASAGGSGGNGARAKKKAFKCESHIICIWPTRP
jgi:hypothetical protein